MLIVTTDDLPGFDIRTVVGQVFGVAVQADQAPSSNQQRSGTFRVTGETPVGLVQARRDAVTRLGEEARRLGANAVVGMSFDNARLPAGGTEVCAYGTAVVAQQAAAAGQAPVASSYGQGQPVPPYQPEPGRPPMVARNMTMGLNEDRNR